jgi:hypothetical protein
MGYRRLGLAVIAASCLFIFPKPEQASALTPSAFAIQADSSARGGAERIAFHHHRAYTFYCYPRNHWWFYRPYTTAFDGHARCMPYFHYLEPYGRGAKRHIK